MSIDCMNHLHNVQIVDTLYQVLFACDCRSSCFHGAPKACPRLILEAASPMYLNHARGLALTRTACLRALRTKRVAAVQRGFSGAANARRAPTTVACLRPGCSDDHAAAGTPFTITTPLYYVNAGAFKAAAMGVWCAVWCAVWLLSSSWGCERHSRAKPPPPAPLSTHPTHSHQSPTWAAPTPPSPPTCWRASSAAAAAGCASSQAPTSMGRRSRSRRRPGACRRSSTATASQRSTRPCGQRWAGGL